MRTGDAYAYPGYVNANRTYTSNGRNQYSAVGGATLTYDSKGNLIDDGTNAFCYSSENLLVLKGPGADVLVTFGDVGLRPVYAALSGGGCGDDAFSLRRTQHDRRV